MLDQLKEVLDEMTLLMASCCEDADSGPPRTKKSKRRKKKKPKTEQEAGGDLNSGLGDQDQDSEDDEDNNNDSNDQEVIKVRLDPVLQNALGYAAPVSSSRRGSAAAGASAAFRIKAEVPPNYRNIFHQYSNASATVEDEVVRQNAYIFLTILEGWNFWQLLYFKGYQLKSHTNHAMPG